MAGFFGLFDYNKPGPGVPNPEDVPPKSPFVVFFEILQRKFWNLVKVNMMFLLFNLPALILGMLVVLLLFPNIIPEALTNPSALRSDMLLKFILLTLLMCGTPMVTFGPAQAGFTYIMRNYAREEHAFLWSDFKETAFKNLKQSMIISSINFVATFIMLWSIRAYLILGRGNLLMTAGSALMVVLFLIFAVMNMYLYPIMITFNLSVQQIYKNGLIFAMIKFLPNVGILLLNAFIILFSFGMVAPFSQIIGIILYMFLTISLTGFLTNFYVYPKLKKYMLSRIEDAEEEEDEDDEDDEDEDEDEEDEAGDEDEGKDSEGSTDGTDVENGDSTDPVNKEDDVKRYF